MLHPDICEPLLGQSIGENRYFLVMAVEKERYTRAKIWANKIESVKNTSDITA